MDLIEIFRKAQIIPVVTIPDLRNVLPLVQALADGGLKVIEITLRTQQAFDAIEMISKSMKDVIVCAGTILTEEQARQAKAAGAQFIVSPGYTDEIAMRANSLDLPWVPAVCTPSEIMRARDHGYQLMKFFPAEVMGGVNALKHYAQVFPRIQFCPTGGVNAQNFQSYLNCPNVPAVGGSWLMPDELVKKQDWKAISEMVKNSRLQN